MWMEFFRLKLSGNTRISWLHGLPVTYTHTQQNQIWRESSDNDKIIIIIIIDSATDPSLPCEVPLNEELSGDASLLGSGNTVVLHDSIVEGRWVRAIWDRQLESGGNVVQDDAGRDDVAALFLVVPVNYWRKTSQE